MDVFSANAALTELTEKEALAFVLLQQVLLLGCAVGAGGETRQGVFPVNNVLSAVGEVGGIFPASAQPTQHAADCREHLKTALCRRFVSERGVFIIPVDPVQGFLGGFCVNGR